MSDIPISAAANPPLQPREQLRVGALAPSLWRVFRRQAGSFYALSAIPLAVSFGITLMEGASRPKQGGSELALVSFISYLVQLAFQSATIYGSGRLAAGTRFGFGAAIAVGCRRLASYFVASLFSGLLVVIGLLLLVFPGLIAFCIYGLAAPASTIETLGPLQAMQRSAQVTQGNRWRVLAAVLLFILVPAIALIVILTMSAQALSAMQASPAWLAVPSLVGVLAYPLVLALWTIFFAVLFIELRAAREGGAPGEAISRVFE